MIGRTIKLRKTRIEIVTTHEHYVKHNFIVTLTKIIFG